MPSPAAKNPFGDKPVYLLYGNRVGDMLRARDQLLDVLLDPETRDENLTEYRATGNRKLELMKLLPEIAGDLDTLSLIPDARKAVVVVDPAEIFTGSWRSRSRRTAKRAKADDGDDEDSAQPAGLRWLEESLPQSGNHLVILAFEDEAESREIDDKGALFQLIAKIGTMRAYRDKKAYFRIEDAILARDNKECLRAIRELTKGSKIQDNVYGNVAKCLRFMLQKSILEDPRFISNPTRGKALLPSRKQFNLLEASDFTRKKYMRAPAPYKMAAMLTAYEKLLKVYHAMRPRPGEFVPDETILLEQILVELFASAPPPARRY